MPDITMCSNYHCDKRKTCYRYLAHPNLEHQAYGDFQPDDDNFCDDFMNCWEWRRMRNVVDVDAQWREAKKIEQTE